MKRLRAVVISVLPWVIGAGAIGGTIVFVANQQHRASEKYEAEREKRCTSSFRLDSEKQDACKHERDTPGNYLPWGYVLVAWPDGIMGWAIIATGFVIAWQSWETRKSAQEAQVAADAALLNAQAFIRAERPWVLVKVEPSKRWEFGQQVVAVNKGRTPAEVICHADNCIVIGIADFLPDIAEYGKTEIYPSAQIILPEESVVIGEITEFSLVGKNKADITRFRNAETEGYVYGSIIYRDLLGPPAAKPHETRWCFSVLTWKERELIVMEYGWGGNEYTRHT
jgi:hypothetical protein